MTGADRPGLRNVAYRDLVIAVLFPRSPAAGESRGR